MAQEEIRLVKPTLKLKKEALEYRQEHFDFGERVINGSELFDRIASYDEWLENFAVRVPDNKIVGIADLRYELNDFLKNFGNCGYSVRPSERNHVIYTIPKVFHLPEG